MSEPGVPQIIERPEFRRITKCDAAILRAICDTASTGKAVMIPLTDEPARAVVDRYRQAVRYHGLIPHFRTMPGHVVLWAVQPVTEPRR